MLLDVTMKLSGKEGLHVIGREIRQKAIPNALLVRGQDMITNLAAEFDVSIRTVKLAVQNLMCSDPVETARALWRRPEDGVVPSDTK